MSSDALLIACTLLTLVNLGLVGLNLKLYTEVQKLRVLRGEEHAKRQR